MSTLDDLYAEDNNFTPVGADLMFASHNGLPKAMDLDALSNAINGQTIAEASIPSAGRAVVRLLDAIGATPTLQIGPVAWGEVDVDTDGFFSGAASDRFTIPSGVVAVELTCTIRALTSGSTKTFTILKNGDTSIEYGFGEYTVGCTVATSPIEVVSGDFLQVVLDDAVTVHSPSVKWSIKVLERTA